MTAEAERPAGGTGTGRGDFRVPGVIIWSEANGNSIHKGLGYPGQGFAVDDIVAGGSYTCDNNETTVIWNHGHNIATGVTGWVPACNIA